MFESCYILLYFHWIFIEKVDSSLPSFGSSSKCLPQLGLGHANLGSWNTILVSHKGGRDTNIWAITCCLPWSVLVGKWEAGSWKLESEVEQALQPRPFHRGWEHPSGILATGQTPAPGIYVSTGCLGVLGNRWLVRQGQIVWHFESVKSDRELKTWCYEK